MKVGVIGSGLAGLAAACTLAARGHQVEVFEKNEWLGGKAAQLTGNGFRFDMGPTILIQPSVLRKIFEEANCNLEDYIPMIRLDPQWRCFFEDGSRIDLTDNAEKMAATLEAIWPKMGAGYLKFLEQSEQLHSISDRFFFWRSIGSMRDTMDVKGAFDLKVLRDVMRMRLGKTVAGVIRENIPDSNVAQMLDHFVQYVGSSPDASPAILCAIGHMQMEEGIWYPMGGTRAVPEGLVKLGTQLGVVYHASTDVEKITSDRGKVTGLTTTDGVHHAFDERHFGTLSAGGGDEDFAARGKEGAHGGFDREVAAALQGEGGVGLGRAAGDFQHAGAERGVDLAEIVVPGRDVLRHGGADFVPRGDGAGDEQLHASPEKLFQGPVADALNHVGQIALLRRMAGCPIKGENYFKADIACGRVGPEQAPPKHEF